MAAKTWGRRASPRSTKRTCSARSPACRGSLPPVMRSRAMTSPVFPTGSNTARRAPAVGRPASGGRHGRVGDRRRPGARRPAALPVPAAVVRGYELPAWVGPSTLVVAVSYSGNTEETLACVEAALARGCTPLCVASGGRLAALAAERGLPLSPCRPVCSRARPLGYLAMPLLAALERLELTRLRRRTSRRPPRWCAR